MDGTLLEMALEKSINEIDLLSVAKRRLQKTIVLKAKQIN